MRVPMLAMRCSALCLILVNFAEGAEEYFLPWEDDGTGPCPKRWEEQGEHCYQFAVKPQTFAVATEKCKEMGAIQAEPYIEKFKDDVMKVVYHAKVDGVFLGATDSKREGEWRWVWKNYPMIYTFWDNGQPADHHKDDDCLYTSRHMWETRNCSEELHYICQKFSKKSPNYVPPGYYRVPPTPKPSVPTQYISNRCTNSAWCRLRGLSGCDQSFIEKCNDEMFFRTWPRENRD